MIHSITPFITNNTSILMIILPPLLLILYIITKKYIRNLIITMIIVIPIVVSGAILNKAVQIYIINSGLTIKFPIGIICVIATCLISCELLMHNTKYNKITLGNNNENINNR